MYKYHLYLITDSKLAGDRSNKEVVEATISGGADLIQLREKDYTTRQLIKEGRELLKVTRKAGIPLIVNDRVDVALAIDADGVHLGQEDMPLVEARKILGKDKIIGISTHNLEQAMEAEAEGADYIGYGPVFATTTKGGAPVGVESLKRVMKVIKIPVFAIGGIKLNNLKQVIEAGTNRVAVVSGIVAADDIKKTSEAYKGMLISGNISVDNPYLSDSKK